MTIFSVHLSTIPRQPPNYNYPYDTRQQDKIRKSNRKSAMTLDYGNLQSHVLNDTKLPQITERFVKPQHTEVSD